MDHCAVTLHAEFFSLELRKIRLNVVNIGGLFGPRERKESKRIEIF